jgi:serine/threonine protein phosphatase PrpC
LKDNLHNNIILQLEFPSNIEEACRKGSFQTEEAYLQLVCPSPDQPHNKAGSCAIVILIVNEDVYIVNVGDSRALGSVSEHPSDSVIQTKAHQAFN